MTEPEHDHLIRYLGEFAPLIAERASGAWVHTVDGRRILDFTSGQVCSTLGHSHPRVVDALHQALEKAIHLDSRMLSREAIELAGALARSLPDPLDKVILLNTGAESNEVALKLAKIATGRFEVVGVSGAFHGLAAGVASYTFLPARSGYGPLLPGSIAVPAPNSYRCPIRHCTERCEMACLEVGFDQVDVQSIGSLAACIVEPVMSSAGVIVPPDGYLRRLRELCDERGMLMIVDEAQTGLGRLGTIYAVEHDGIVPDIITLSKTLGGGIPLAATATTTVVEERAVSRGFSHITSHISDPLPAAAGLSVLSTIEEEGLVDRAAETGAYLQRKLIELQESHECIGHVRGRGLLAGMELVTDRDERTPARGMAKAVAAACLERGLSLHAIPTGESAHCFRIAPPLTITHEEIDIAIAILDAALTEVASTRVRTSFSHRGAAPAAG